MIPYCVQIFEWQESTSFYSDKCHRQSYCKLGNVRDSELLVYDVQLYLHCQQSLCIEGSHLLPALRSQTISGITSSYCLPLSLNFYLPHILSTTPKRRWTEILMVQSFVQSFLYRFNNHCLKLGRWCYRWSSSAISSIAYPFECHSMKHDSAFTHRHCEGY